MVRASRICSLPFLDFSEFNNFNDTDNDDIYKNCGKTYGCFEYPPNCISSKDCSMLVTYAQLDTGDVNFVLKSKPSKGNR